MGRPGRVLTHVRRDPEAKASSKPRAMKRIWILISCIALLAAATFVSAQPREPEGETQGRRRSAWPRSRSGGRSRTSTRALGGHRTRTSQPVAAGAGRQVGQGQGPQRGSRLLEEEPHHPSKQLTRRIPARSVRRVRLRITMSADAADACQGAKFPLRYRARVRRWPAAGHGDRRPAGCDDRTSRRGDGRRRLERGGGNGEAYSKANALNGTSAPSVNVTGRQVAVSWTAPGGPVPATGYESSVTTRRTTCRASASVLGHRQRGHLHRERPSRLGTGSTP